MIKVKDVVYLLACALFIWAGFMVIVESSALCRYEEECAR